MKLKIKTITPDAIIPQKRSEDGGYDLFTTEKEDVCLWPGEIHFFPTGIAIELPEEYSFLFRERGSTGTKGISVRAGVIDSGYRDQMFVAINNTSNEPIIFSRDEKSVKEKHNLPEHAKIYNLNKAIAQGLIVHTPDWDIELVDNLSESERGADKLGSTNK